MRSRLGILAVFALMVLVAAFAGRGSACTKDGSASDAGAPTPVVVTSPELRAQLRAAALAKGPGYVPRTRHKNPDGSAKYTNRLIREASPYLLQHAHNPVDWFPWGDEAFETARRLGRPILLSVGYSTCHWCHVMEEESFENEEVAAAINEGYVAIKVDREERPDVDAVYMSAVQSLTGSGGWPMTVWLTPDRKPFHGGTYFPARTFLPLLRKLQTMYGAEPAQVASTAEAITSDLRKQMAAEVGARLPDSSNLEQTFVEYRKKFDPEHGGRRGAPKFPSSFPVRLMLRDHAQRSGTTSTQMAATTLEQMSRGGIYDQVGGGFHRYSTDDHWGVPHFEKMLYDNALLVLAYLDGHQATQRADFVAVAKDILRYVARDMTTPDGAFYSATDADSLAPDGRLEEGWFFTWSQAEFTAALGEPSGRVWGGYYGVTSAGQLDGRSVLHLTAPVPPIPPVALEGARANLFAARQERAPPLRDEKVLTSWNALMISAYARASLVTGEAAYAASAERAADFVLRALVRDGRLLRAYEDGAAKLDAYLDDYAFSIAALLDLHEATGRARWLEEAIRLETVVETHYADPAAGGFFLTGDDHEQLLAREKPSYDGAEPSGTSVMALDLLRLHALTGRVTYRERAERCLAGVGQALASSPTSLSEMLLALDYALDVPKEIVIVTPHQRSEAEPFVAKLRSVFLPNRVFVVVPEGEELTKLAAIVPLVAEKTARHGKTTAYVCERQTCELPTTEPDAFWRQLVEQAARPRP